MDLNTTDMSVLIRIIEEQTLTISSLNKTIEDLNVDSKILREQIEFLTKKLFGTKSEKTAALTGQTVIDGLEYGQFDEAEAQADPEEIETVITKKKTRKGYLSILKLNK